MPMFGTNLKVPVTAALVVSEVTFPVPRVVPAMAELAARVERLLPAGLSLLIQALSVWVVAVTCTLKQTQPKAEAEGDRQHCRPGGMLPVLLLQPHPKLVTVELAAVPGRLRRAVRSQSPGLISISTVLTRRAQ